MQKALAVLLVALAAQAAYGQQRSSEDARAVIQGSVTRSGSGEPLPDVHITLRGGAATVTDRQGNFTISDVLPGTRYTVQAQKDGFYPDMPSSGPRPAVPSFGAAVQIKSEPELRQVAVDSAKEYTVNFELVPGGDISGRILGPDRRPIPHVNVTLLRLEYQSGKRSLQTRGSTETDDLGEFRIFWIKPGNYFLSAEYRPQVPSASDPRNTLAKTFYPGVLDENAGASIQILPAGEAPANFFMVSTAKVKVSGRVINSVSDASASSFYLIPRNSTVSGDNITPFRNQAADRSNGKFELRDVTPGSYYLFPVISASNGVSLTGRTAVDTAYSDVEGVTAVIHPNVELKGQIAVDPSGQLDDALRKRLSGLALRLHAIDPIPGIKARTLETQVADDGSLTFSFAGLPEGTYQLESVGGAGGRILGSGYLADFRQGARTVINDGLVTVGADDAEPLLLTFRLDGGRIQGTVTTADQKPAPTATVSVIPRAELRQNPLFYKHATTDSNGRFVVNGIGPGDYEVFAWENLQSGADESADFVAQFERDGQRVTISRSLVTNVSLRAIPDQSQK